eukprot:TRINITY_DN7319_c0_g1_i2.p1 TRINITY_DN7319_c0_g1~~TRINITY_DN7319_c0_g1_i2.p1  ORF type:complete len:307 (+),score=69.06 TRINITY_DN7319_c0_g1_i2:418-1338(+)
MGGTVASIVDWEQAQIRCSPRELERWNRAFQRYSKDKHVLEKSLFIKLVLGPRVPTELGERLFRVFVNGQGTEAIDFKSFVCGMAVFLKGELEEKIQLLFTVYGGEAGFLSREAVEKFLFATSAIPVKTTYAKYVDDIFSGFLDKRISYGDWRAWLHKNKESDLPMVKWIFYPPPPVEEGVETDVNIPLPSRKDLSNSTTFSKVDFDFLWTTYEQMLIKNPFYREKGTLLDRSILFKFFCPPLQEELASIIFDAFFVTQHEFLDILRFINGLHNIYSTNFDIKLILIYKAIAERKKKKKKKKSTLR